MDKLNYSISYLAILINAYNGDGFTKVETATCSIFQGQMKIGETFLGAAGNNNAVLSGIIYKTMPTWSFLGVTNYGSGKNFTECDKLILDNLETVGFNPILLEESKNWKPNTKKFNLAKEQVICMPPGINNF